MCVFFFLRMRRTARRRRGLRARGSSGWGALGLPVWARGFLSGPRGRGRGRAAGRRRGRGGDGRRQEAPLGVAHHSREKNGPYLRQYLERVAEQRQPYRRRPEPHRVDFYRRKDEFIARMRACGAEDWREARTILDEAVERHQESIDAYLLRRDDPVGAGRGGGDGGGGHGEMGMGMGVAPGIVHADEAESLGFYQEAGVDEWGAQLDPLGAPLVPEQEAESGWGDEICGTVRMEEGWGDADQFEEISGFDGTGKFDEMGMDHDPMHAPEPLDNAEDAVAEWKGELAGSGTAEPRGESPGSDAPLTRQQLAMQIMANLPSDAAPTSSLNEVLLKKNSKQKKRDRLIQNETSVSTPHIPTLRQEEPKNTSMDDWVCPKCGASNYAWHKFCIECEQRPAVPEKPDPPPDSGLMKRIMERSRMIEGIFVSDLRNQTVPC